MEKDLSLRLGHWRCYQAPETRRKNIFLTTDRGLSMKERYNQAFRKMMVLAKTTDNQVIKEVSLEDADYFYKKTK